MSVLERRLNKFITKQPEVVLEWKDPLSEAVGYIVIHTIKNGAAKAKVIIRKGITQSELIEIAKYIEVRNTISGPPVGGAAIGLDFDRNDTRYQSIFDRFFKVLAPIVKSYCGLDAGENISSDEIEAQSNKMGLLHPWEGIVAGYLSYSPDNKFRSTIRVMQGFQPYSEEEKLAAISRLQQRHSIPLKDERFFPTPLQQLTVDEILIGWGIAESIRHYYMIYGGFIHNKFVLIQGWNSVSATTAFFLCKYGALIAGIIDEKGGIISEKGLGIEDIINLFVHNEKKELNALPRLDLTQGHQQFWDIPAEIFVAHSPTLTISQEQAELLVKSGIEVMALASEHPFADTKPYMGEIATYLDSKTSLIHPIIAASGKDRLSAYLLKKEGQLVDIETIKDCSEIIRQSIMRLHQFNPKRTGIFAKALELSLTDLV
ncbi:MAG: hypothetical protein M0R38_07240 [Bacteroidia bacterium]|nr:hypothetical protein [Bacteroidia bacterium]